MTMHGMSRPQQRRDETNSMRHQPRERHVLKSQHSSVRSAWRTEGTGRDGVDGTLELLDELEGLRRVGRRALGEGPSAKARWSPWRRLNSFDFDDEARGCGIDEVKPDVGVLHDLDPLLGGAPILRPKPNSTTPLPRGSSFLAASFVMTSWRSSIAPRRRGGRRNPPCSRRRSCRASTRRTS